jgi:hypothetical protein
MESQFDEFKKFVDSIENAVSYAVEKPSKDDT